MREEERGVGGGGREREEGGGREVLRLAKFLDMNQDIGVDKTTLSLYQELVRHAFRMARQGKGQGPCSTILLSR